MSLVIFDLDETMIHGDCSSLWSQRMASLGWVDESFVRRDTEFKAQLIAELGLKVWPLFSAGKLRAQLERTFPIGDAEAAFEALASNQVQGKVVLVVDPSLA